MGDAASRVEGKFYYVIPGEIDANGDPIYHCRACDYVCKNPSGIRLHWLKKHGEQGVESAHGGQGKDKPRKAATAGEGGTRGIQVCTICGGPVALLRGSDPRHAKAIHSGYTRYCQKCEEVFK